MNVKNAEDICKDLKEETNFDKGDLVLIIVCTKCDAHFSINPESIACAMLTNASIWEYIKFVQMSKCKICNKEQGANHDYTNTI